MFLFEKHMHDFIIHFVGIGGIGMSGIAEIMHNLGYKVQGSDIAENDNIKKLKSYGINIFLQHSAENVLNATYVVISSAIKFDNPEVIAALENKIPLIRRAEMLAELMRLKYSIAVSGSHGKTTTTSLIACLFEAAGLAPTVINGGIINNKLTNAYIGTGKYLIAEADESDATFISIPSTIGVITNIDPEHMDFYKTFDNLIAAFRSFIINLPFYGFAVACIDHPTVRELANNITERRVITYGINSQDANLIAYNIDCTVNSSSFDIRFVPPHTKGATIIENITIPTLGRHNVLNSLAAIAIALELDFGTKVIKQGFKAFQGIKRRFSKVCEYKGVPIIDDYAHHPIEIMATLNTARIVADNKQGRIIAFFQPHRYSRLKSLFQEFTKCFDQADVLYITDVYSAGENALDNISSANLVSEINKSNKKEAKLIDKGKEIEQIAEIIKTTANPNDLILMMGAGNISTWANSLSNILKD